MCQNVHIPEKLAKICMSHQMTPFIDFSQNDPILLNNISSKILSIMRPNLYFVFKVGQKLYSSHQMTKRKKKKKKKKERKEKKKKIHMYM